MCGFTKQAEPIVADKNILCCKIVDKASAFNFFGNPLKVKSSHRRFVYKLYKKIQVEVDLTKDWEDGSIYFTGTGLYSYINILGNWRYDETTVLAVIPKGAKYYLCNDNNLRACNVGISPDIYVSDQLIYIGIDNRFTRWVLRRFYGIERE